MNFFLANIYNIWTILEIQHLNSKSKGKKAGQAEWYNKRLPNIFIHRQCNSEAIMTFLYRFCCPTPWFQLQFNLKFIFWVKVQKIRKKKLKQHRTVTLSNCNLLKIYFLNTFILIIFFCQFKILILNYVKKYLKTSN